MGAMEQTTAAALGAKRFSKSPDRLAARAQLQALRGRTHELHAAITFVHDGAAVFEGLDELAATAKKLAVVETAEQKRADEEGAAEEAVARGEILQRPNETTERTLRA
jgi:predicted house-cleaning NTP pyrophosphatase (Maf/HAM1 superfamily)